MTPSIIFDIAAATARHGNTTALVEAAKATGATVIAHSEPYAATLRRQGVKVLSVHLGPANFVGRPGPFFVDLPVLTELAAAWDAARKRAEAADREAAAAKAEARKLQGEMLLLQGAARLSRLLEDVRLLDRHAERAWVAFDPDADEWTVFTWKAGVRGNIASGPTDIAALEEAVEILRARNRRAL